MRNDVDTILRHSSRADKCSGPSQNIDDSPKDSKDTKKSQATQDIAASQNSKKPSQKSNKSVEPNRKGDKDVIYVQSDPPTTKGSFSDN